LGGKELETEGPLTHSLEGIEGPRRKTSTRKKGITLEGKTDSKRAMSTRKKSKRKGEEKGKEGKETPH